MDLHLKDKIIIVTGGAKGVGEGIVNILADENAIPIIVGRNESDCIKTVKKIRDKGLNADYVVAELTKAEACKKAVEEVVKKYNRIDGLVNNAGINDRVGLENGDYDSFIASINKNLTHYFLMVKYALSELKKRKGAIVNIGSKTATTGQGGTSGYVASNGGRNALTREWALELLPYSIRVNSVIVADCYTPLYHKWIQTFPNPEEKLKVLTSKIPFEKRSTTPEEIANMVSFLLSPVSSHTTGQIIYVDGGYTHLDRAIT